MRTQTGQCPNCHATNAYTATSCIDCGQSLPWANVAAQAQQQQPTIQVPQQPAPVVSPAPTKKPYGLYACGGFLGIIVLGALFSAIGSRSVTTAPPSSPSTTLSESPQNNQETAPAQEPAVSISNADIEFAKTAFQSLARGDSAAEKVIDWETFQSMGQNVGMTYIAMPNDTEKAKFRKSFIAQFSSSFQSTGASADSLKNWRVQGQDSARTIIAADTPSNKTLLITVSKRDDKQKISAIGVD